MCDEKQWRVCCSRVWAKSPRCGLRFFFFSSRRRHTRWTGDWSSDVCSSDLTKAGGGAYWAYHAANVAVLSIAFGARLGMVKRRRHDLGMASLFHDVGLAALPIELLHKDTPLSQQIGRASCRERV